MASLMPTGKQQYLDSAGAPLAGGKLYTYAAGTSTPLATYSDQAGATPNANPVVLDARGEATIFWAVATGYKAELRDSADALIWTQDDLYAPAIALDNATFLGVRCADGTVAAPAHSYTNETGSGLYRAGAGDHRFAISGTDRAKLTASGFFADLFQSLTLISATVKGAVADGASAVGVILDNTVTLANATAKLVSFRSNGSEKASVDKDGKGFFVGVDAGAQKITNVLDPTSAQDAATMNWAAPKASPTFTGTATAATLVATPEAISPSAGSNWNITGTIARRSAGLVFLMVYAQASPGASFNSILTMPAGSRPPASTAPCMGAVQFFTSGDLDVCRFALSSAGVLSATYYDNGTKLVAMPVLTAGDIVEIVITYPVA